ncbi:hypothetical protein EXN66_Car014932 [Channa argus]|uniref:Uncharacterized protein n=1 Tax=Channa argus TaxID=215402 RepID=A0A6G1Q9M2_CHAAH|nr:hypothetical protein EXN66_Car014932 [Channa argus]
MHMVWVGLTRLHLHLNPGLQPGTPPKEDPVGMCVGGGGRERDGGMHWARGAETFEHRPSQRRRENSQCHL